VWTIPLSFPVRSPRRDRPGRRDSATGIMSLGDHEGRIERSTDTERGSRQVPGSKMVDLDGIAKIRLQCSGVGALP